ncbi:D-erythrulose reductase-like [Artemia franciscana]|uniref:L-xylulose reductase n=1 Tax=Artemia franciscana TaxID=6661 RepID=A0AA88HXT0_ARTSF|nr:hypothetical protein QYM36_008671 [Artemia franciscana]KAK2714182.1 hypothetical protein QYM36_008671 [Artemia franciscana]
MDFRGKTALVTGAGQGIGYSVARKLASLGAKVYALSKNESHLAKLVDEEKSIHPVCCDLTDWDSTKLKVAGIGQIDLLVNNAGVGKLEPFLIASSDAFDWIFNVNVKAVMNVSQVVASGMVERKHGAIVNVSSQASQAALKEHAIYCASKAALDSMTRVMALELGPHNIRVNTVNPTVVLTELGRSAWADPQKGGEMKAKIPLGRFAEVDDVVNAIVFLLSDNAAMITGTCLPVDGGYLAC